MISLLVLFFCISHLDLCLGGVTMGQVNKYDLMDVGTCENDVGTIAYVDLVKEGEEKWMSGNITIDYDINEEINFKGQSDRWSGSEWKEGYTRLAGNLCKTAESAGKNTWKSLIDSASPKPENYLCNIPKGTYSVEKFVPNIKEMLPAAPYGRYRGFLQLYQGTKVIFCLKGEVELKN